MTWLTLNCLFTGLYSARTKATRAKNRQFANAKYKKKPNQNATAYYNVDIEWFLLISVGSMAFFSVVEHLFDFMFNELNTSNG